MTRIIVGKESEIQPGTSQKVVVNGADVLVVNIDGRFYAVGDTCTHQGASLSEGSLDGSTITCGWHGAQFDCKTGRLTKFPAQIKDLGSYRITTESGNVFIEV